MARISHVGPAFTRRTLDDRLSQCIDSRACAVGVVSLLLLGMCRISGRSDNSEHCGAKGCQLTGFHEANSGAQPSLLATLTPPFQQMPLVLVALHGSDVG
jgi:hypothetical protein